MSRSEKINLDTLTDQNIVLKRREELRVGSEGRRFLLDTPHLCWRRVTGEHGGCGLYWNDGSVPRLQFEEVTAGDTGTREDS